VTTSTRALQQVADARRFIASGEARQLREALNLSLMDVAPTLLADPSAIGRWERGERIPRGPAAIKYVRLLKRLSARMETTCAPAA